MNLIKKRNGTRKKKKNLENFSQFLGTRAGGIFFKDEKKEEGEGGRKKKGRGKGGRKKGGGKISFFTGALYNFYVHSTILKISTPAAGRHLGFFLASLEKNRVGGSVFSFPASCNPPLFFVRALRLDIPWHGDRWK